MRSVHRVTAFGLVALVAAMAFAGCSSVGPADTWSGDTGSLEGTVRSDAGQTLADIEVWIWTEWDGEDVWHQTTTDQAGEYEISDVLMPTTHTYSETYSICVNRTPESGTSIDTNYGTYRATIIVRRSEVSTADCVIVFIEDEPGEPEVYIDG